jgi:hypothetical protein
MARPYSSTVENATLATALTNALNCLTATAAVRITLAELIVGSRATADAAASYKLMRHVTTAPAGGTSITPSPLDNGDPAAVVVSRTGATGTALSTGPTAGVTIFAFGLHQRAPMRWIANPGYEPKSPAGANDGFSFVCTSVTSAFAVDLALTFQE